MGRQRPAALDELIEAELDDLERNAGLQVAVVEEYQDGHYSMRVANPILTLGDFASGTDPPLVIPEVRFEPCHIPRFRRRVVWKQYDEAT